MGKLTPKNYKDRLIDAEVATLLQTFGAVEINGAMWCGKTWTALNHANSVTNLDDDDNAELAKVDAALILEGKRPHLIDEWQLAPSARDSVRRSVDASGNMPGMYLLTGSSAPLRGEVSHSGAGRIASVRMRPMTLSEMGISNKSISLQGLFTGEFKTQQVDTHLDDIAQAICRGGWPASQNIREQQYMRLPQQYLRSIYEYTAPRFGMDPHLAQRLLYALARNDGESASLETLTADASEGEAKLHQQAVREYLSFFKRIYLIEDMSGWDAPVKARARIRTRPKRYFVDPSLAIAALGLSPKGLLEDFQLLGKMFESLCVRDLRVYLSATQQTAFSDLRYYRDDYGLEVDAIIELPDRRWAGIEFKLSENKVDQGVQNLLRLKQKIAVNPLAKNAEPEFLAVITARSPFARKTPEGVYVIPITCLTA